MLISISELLNSTYTHLDRAYSFDENQAPFRLDRRGWRQGLAVSGKQREVVIGVPDLGTELWGQAVQASPRTNYGMLRGLVQFSSVQSLSCVPLFVTPWTAAHQASLSFIISWSLLKLMFKSVMPSNHLILCRHLLLLPSIFPSIRVFSNESALLFFFNMNLFILIGG